MSNTQWDIDTLQQYKNFRNNLRRTNRSESLYVLWNYAQNLQFGRLINQDIEVHEQFVKAKTWIEKSVHPWEVEVLTREAILWGSENKEDHTLRKWQYMADTTNKLKHFENYLAAKYIEKNDVLTELMRISHRQFPWQSQYPNDEIAIRYYKIFNTKELGTIIENATGLTLNKLYTIWLAFTGLALQRYSVKYLPNVQLPNITVDDVRKFLSIYSLELSKLKEILSAETEINDRYVYKFCSIKKYPIIRMDAFGIDSLVIPVPTHLFWRLTSGLYYDLYNTPNFDHAFGDSFQDYIGAVIAKGCPVLQLIPEFSYSKDKKSTDWILHDGKTGIFIECKTKRLTDDAKTHINDVNLEAQMDIAADFVIQVYKNILDYKEGRYRDAVPNNLTNLYPLIVTLEDWYFYGDKLYKILETKVTEKLTNKGLDLNLVKTYPFSICSAQDFENIVQVLSLVDIDEFFKKKVFDNDKLLWSFYPYVHETFPNETKKIKALFHDDYTRLFDVGEGLSI